MRHTKEPARWGLFEWIVLTTGAALLGACVALAWFYVSGVRGDLNTSVAAKNEFEMRSALLALKEQQVLTNLKLDAIRDELHALNEKAGTAASVTPP